MKNNVLFHRHTCLDICSYPLVPASSNSIKADPIGIGEENEIQNFTCNTSSSHPRSEIAWFIGDACVSHNAWVIYLPGAYGGWRTKSTISVVLSREFNERKAQCKVVYVGSEKEDLTREHYIQMTFSPTSNSMEELPMGPLGEGFTKEFTCTTGSSSPDHHIEWSVGGVNMTHLAEYAHHDGEYGGWSVSSTLRIRLFREHTGLNVSCTPIFENMKQGTLERCTWINTTYPNDVRVQVVSMATEGEEVQLSCLAERGNPEHVDETIWQFHPKDSYGDWQTLACREKNCILSRAEYYHAGIYVCVAKNWGANLLNSGAAALDVQYTAHVIVNTTTLDVYADPGETVKHVANLKVYPPDVLVKCHLAHAEEVDQEMINVVNTGKEEVRVEVLITDVDYQRHEYTNCKGYSSAGESSEFTFRILRPGPPEKPLNVQAEYITANSLYVSFTSGLNGGSLQTFRARYRRVQDDIRESIDEVGDPGKGNRSSIKITKLEADMAYYITVVAKNNFTEHSTSESEQVNYLTKRAPVVEDITVSEDGNLTIVSWTLDNMFHYTRQIIEECYGILDYTNRPCTIYHIKHGDSARLFLEKGKDYDVHLALYDHDDQVFRKLVYQTNRQECATSRYSVWVVASGVLVGVLSLIGVLLSVLLYHQCQKNRQTEPKDLWRKQIIAPGGRKHSGFDGPQLQTADITRQSAGSLVGSPDDEGMDMGRYTQPPDSLSTATSRPESYKYEVSSNEDSSNTNTAPVGESNPDLRNSGSSNRASLEETPGHFDANVVHLNDIQSSQCSEESV